MKNHHWVFNSWNWSFRDQSDHYTFKKAKTLLTAPDIFSLWERWDCETRNHAAHGWFVLYWLFPNSSWASDKRMNTRLSLSLSFSQLEISVLLIIIEKVVFIVKMSASLPLCINGGNEMATMKPNIHGLLQHSSHFRFHLYNLCFIPRDCNRDFRESYQF